MDPGLILAEAKDCAMDNTTSAEVRPKIRPPKPSKAPAEAFKSGEAVTLTASGTKTARGKVILTKTWTSPDVGVFIDFPLEGSPQQRTVIGAYAMYALCKTAKKLYRLYEYGSYNPRMKRDGVSCIETMAPVETDGAPSRARLEMMVKGTKAGQLLGALLAKSCFSPPTSDLSQPELSCIGRDPGVLMWAAKQYNSLVEGAGFSVMIVGGKRTSVRKNMMEKFKTTFDKKLSAPSITGATAPKEVTLKPEHSMPFKAPSGASLVAVAHVLSGFGNVWQSGSKVGVCIPPEDQKISGRQILKLFRNGNKSAAAMLWYERISARDKIGTLGSALAAAAVGVGLPVETAEKMLSISSLSARQIVSDVQKCAE